MKRRSTRERTTASDPKNNNPPPSPPRGSARTTRSQNPKPPILQQPVIRETPESVDAVSEAAELEDADDAGGKEDSDDEAVASELLPALRSPQKTVAHQYGKRKRGRPRKEVEVEVETVVREAENSTAVGGRQNRRRVVPDGDGDVQAVQSALVEEGEVAPEKKRRKPSARTKEREPVAAEAEVEQVEKGDQDDAEPGVENGEDDSVEEEDELASEQEEPMPPPQPSAPKDQYAISVADDDYDDNDEEEEEEIQEDTIFTEQRGGRRRPIPFWVYPLEWNDVQVWAEEEERTKLVEHIVTLGGKVVQDRAKSDYAILPPRVKDLRGYADVIRDSSTVALEGHFITESVFAATQVSRENAKRIRKHSSALVAHKIVAAEPKLLPYVRIPFRNYLAKLPKNPEEEQKKKEMRSKGRETFNEEDENVMAEFYNKWRGKKPFSAAGMCRDLAKEHTHHTVQSYQNKWKHNQERLKEIAKGLRKARSPRKEKA